MTDVSTNKQIRRQQFRATAKEILERAKASWGSTDRIGQLANAMERAYAAGASNAGLPEEKPSADGHVRWDAIPRRSQELLQDITALVRHHADAIRQGTVLAIVENAGEISARGERASFSVWSRTGDDLRLIDGVMRERWASSTASALVRLGILAPIMTTDDAARWTVLTPVGLATMQKAVEDDHLFTWDCPRA